MVKCGFKHTFYYFSWIKSTLKPTFYYEKGGDFDFLHILRIKSPRLRLGLFIAAKCVKSQNHPPFYTMKGTKSLKWFQSFCPFSSIVSLHGSGLDNISNLASTAAVPCWVDSGKCTFENTNSSSMQESLIGWRRVMSWAKETGKCSTWKAPNERVGKPQMRGGESPNWRKEDAFSLRRGKQMADQKRKKYSWKMPKMECPNERRGKPKWEEGRKAAAQPHPVDLC